MVRYNMDCLLNLVKNVYQNVYVIHYRVMVCFCKIQTDAKKSAIIKHVQYSTFVFKLCLQSENEYLVGLFCVTLYLPYLIFTLLYTAHL